MPGDGGSRGPTLGKGLLMADTAKAATARIEKTRSGFRSLIAANPNYFGNLPESGFKAIKKLASNQNYEELTTVGYHPWQRRLFATFDVKRSFGYSGDLCDDGSNEYVRFYVDFGAGWQDAGVVATDVHDIPSDKDCANRDSHPLTYSLEQYYAPPKKWCTSPQLPRVRGILSWNVEPPANSPNWVPVYGNVVECNIQIAKSIWFGDFLDDLVAKVDIPGDLLGTITPVLPQPPPDVPDIPGLPEPPLPGPEPVATPLQLDELIEAYHVSGKGKRAKLAVEPKRFAFPQVQALVSQETVALDASASIASVLDGIGIDISDLVAEIEDTTGDISFEELTDVGLDGNREKLVATFRVKKPSGFSGGLCTAGSTEYVAFWADWNDTCDWTYLGTGSVKAYDFEDLPDGGLCYTVTLPVDLTEFRERCQDPKVARVRAVLSWNTPPSAVDPDALPVWGNRLDAHVLVPRREGAPGTLTVIGGISTEFISDATGMASATAKFVDTGISVYSPLGLECPFGGLIVVRGPAQVGKRYRIRAVDSGGAIQTLTEKIWVTPVLGVSGYHTGTADGWFDYLPHSQNFAGILGYYRSSGEDLVTIELEIEGEGVVDSQAVQLDNTRPDVAVTITDPGTDCGLFEEGVTISGLALATDTHMGSWSVAIDGGPAGFGPVGVASGSANTPPGGAVWSFDTSGLEQCGYVVEITARDRTIVNSQNSQWRRATDVGFCLLDGKGKKPKKS